MKTTTFAELAARWQARKLRSLVRLAYEQVPFYRNKFVKMGIKPESIQTLRDIVKLPLMSKNELKTAFPDAILADKFKTKHPVVVSTGGHTGMPVKLYRNRRQIDNSSVALALLSPFIPWLVKYWTGLRIGKRISFVYPVDPEYDIYLIIKKALKWPDFFSSYLQYVDSALTPIQQLQAIEAHQPDILATDPNTLCNLAIAARKYGIKPYRPSLLFIGEEHMDANVKDIVTRTFGETYVEHYGAEEVGTVGISCLKHGGFHILPSVIVEILRNGRHVPPGTCGDIVVTDLTNTASPILRYTGLKDSGMISPDPCRCGSRSPLLILQEGRVRDSLLLPDMHMIHPRSMVAAFKSIPGINDYQVVQQSKDRLKISIVPEYVAPGGVPAQDDQPVLVQTVLANLKRLVGEKVQLEIELVDRITASERLMIHPNVLSKIRQDVINSF